MWTNAQAAGSSTSPLLGALLGLLLAIALCVGLYRRVLTVNLSRLFTVTGAVLVVIVAGVLAYGITDLQDAGVLPGLNNVAFDVSAQVSTGTWWSETVRGVTNLNNRMSWLSVIAYLGYIAVVLPLLLRRPASSARRWVVAGAILAVPAVVAAVWVGVDHSHTEPTPDGRAVTVTDTSCAGDWATPDAGTTVYSVSNRSSHAVDVEIVTSSGQAVVAEIEVLGPGTTRELPATLGTAAYHWRCGYSGARATTSISRVATGGTDAHAFAGPALKPTTAADLAPALARYRAYVGHQLATLDGQVSALDHDIAVGDRAAARRDWLTAHLTYHRIGAAYDAFGDAGDADGLASGLSLGTSDPGFVGFHRIEWGLWSGQPLAQLRPYALALVKAVDVLHSQRASFTFDPNDVTIRAHEILEDTIRFVLTSQSDYGSGSGYATAQADLAGDQVLVALLAPVLAERSATLMTAVHRDTATLRDALATGIAGGTSVAHAPLRVKQQVNAATSQLAETLAPIPDLLEVRTQ